MYGSITPRSALSGRDARLVRRCAGASTIGRSSDVSSAFGSGISSTSARATSRSRAITANGLFLAELALAQRGDGIRVLRIAGQMIAADAP